MSWWGERPMKPKKGAPKGGAKMSKMPALPSLYGGSAKKPEPDNKPKMPAMKKAAGTALRKRLADRAL